MPRNRARLGLTLPEMIAILVVISLLTAVITISLSGSRRRGHIVSLRCASQMRGVMQALIVWGQNNQDQFPLPSLLDTQDNTVAGEPASKDTTANIMSILVYNGFFAPELLVCSSEANPNISRDEDFTLFAPGAAVNPRQALWDPAFSADFTGGRTGNMSYAHIQPFGDRAKYWRSDHPWTTPILSDRGPEIVSVAAGAGGSRTAKLRLKGSIASSLHGTPDHWKGYVAYSDNHVDLEDPTSNAGPNALQYMLKDGATSAPDFMFFDEQDGIDGSNQFLSIFTKAGAAREDWTAIWD